MHWWVYDKLFNKHEKGGENGKDFCTRWWHAMVYWTYNAQGNVVDIVVNVGASLTEL